VVKRNRNGVVRNAVEIVRGPVQWIDDPFVLALSRSTAFLGKDGVVRVGPADDADNLGFRHLVHLADVVVPLLGADAEGVDPVAVLQDDLAGGPGGGQRDVCHGVHGYGR
jgi:hypothetical protein